MITRHATCKGALLSAFVGLLSLTGCVQTQATMLDPTERAPLTEDQVRVYRTAENVECEYTEVAVINAQGSAGGTNESQMVSAAKKRAARIGANGVILGTVNEPSAGARIAGAIFGVGSERRGEMLAIFVDEPCRPRTQATPAASGGQ